MRLSHDPLKTSARFDDPNLVSRAGLVPVMALAERAGLLALARKHVTVAGPGAANADLKVGCLVAGMAAGADSIDDMDMLRHGAMAEVFDGVRAPSTLGSFLRPFTWGNVLQLGKVSRVVLAELARRADLLPGAARLAFVDVDSTQRRVYGHAKQGAVFGHTKIQGETVLVRGLNALTATICTPGAAPVVAAAVSTAADAGCTGTIVVRMDSGYYSATACQAACRAGAYFSVTARMDPAVKAAIFSIPEDAWTAINYPPTLPGSSWPASRTTSCARPGAWPRRGTPGPAPPPSAPTSSMLPPGWPGTAAVTSPCTCRWPGTASPNGSPSSRPAAGPPAARAA